MPYWKLFYHLVWSTKERLPLLTPEIEQQIYGFLQRKAVALGATPFALNGVADHVHFVVAIPPAVSVARFVGQVKAAASALANKNVSQSRFAWQAEYGAFSLDAKRLAAHVAYVERQKEHHLSGQLIRALEPGENEF